MNHCKFVRLPAGRYRLFPAVTLESINMLYWYFKFEIVEPKTREDRQPCSGHGYPSSSGFESSTISRRQKIMAICRLKK